MNEWECNDDVLYPKSFLFPDYKKIGIIHCYWTNIWEERERERENKQIHVCMQYPHFLIIGACMETKYSTFIIQTDPIGDPGELGISIKYADTAKPSSLAFSWSYLLRPILVLIKYGNDTQSIILGKSCKIFIKLLETHLKTIKSFLANPSLSMCQIRCLERYWLLSDNNACRLVE